MNRHPSAPGQVWASVSEWALTIVESEAGEAVGTQTPVSGRITIGRDRSCDCVLADPTVSRVHAAVEPMPDGLRVLDLESGNGVWVGDQRVKESVVASGQQFRIGSTVFQCVAPIGRGAPFADAPTTFIERPDAASIASPQPAARTPFLVRILEGNERGTEVVVKDGVAMIGRAADCTVVVSDVDVSRQHARIESTPDGFMVTDAGSSYGLWVGSTEVSSHLLRAGETFRLGQSVVLECASAERTDRPSPDATSFMPGGTASPAAIVPAPVPPARAPVQAKPASAPPVTPPAAAPRDAR